MCDQETQLDTFCGHVLTTFEQVRELAGWDPSITSRTRAYPNGRWHLNHIRAELKKVARKTKYNLNPKDSASRIDDFLTLYFDKLDNLYDTTDSDMVACQAPALHTRRDGP